MTDSSALAPGTVLENNYQIIHEIGRGGFARTYLANNLRRFNEQCVLKQFAPENSGNGAKATELFEREASVMYKLDHDQIPKFREQFKAYTATGVSLFIVQDYVAGENYWQLVEGRGRLFSEAEACDFLRKVLPVLGYIHACGVIHRDISPDNIICRQSDGMPILIDFGAVREAAAKYSQAQSTIVGKVGFAPEEQMRRGQVGADTDLYALAATVLALLTGKEPDKLYNSRTARWDWEHLVKLSPELTKVLEKMLSYQAKNRYQSAGAVLTDLPRSQQLSQKSSRIGRPMTAVFSQLKTMVVSPKAPTAARPKSVTATAEWKKPAKGVTKFVVISLLLAGGGSAGWNWLKQQKWTAANLPQVDTNQLNQLNKFDLGKTMSEMLPKSFDPMKTINDNLPKSFDPMKSVNQAVSNVWPIDFKGQGKVDETTIRAKSKAVQKRLKAEGRSAEQFYKQVDQVFYKKHPNLKNRALQPGEKDRQLRYEWWSIAEGMVE